VGDSINAGNISIPDTGFETYKAGKAEVTAEDDEDEEE
jgi:hypothetical protein